MLRVRYPGFGGLVVFDVADDDAREIETATTLIANQTSLGGVSSSMESRWRWEGDRIPRGLLRLSVGLEDVEDDLGRPRHRARPRRARQLTRRNGAHAGLLRLPAGSAATTQNRSCRLLSFNGTGQRTCT